VGGIGFELNRLYMKFFCIINQNEFFLLPKDQAYKTAIPLHLIAVGESLLNTTLCSYGGLFSATTSCMNIFYEDITHVHVGQSRL